MPVKFFCNQCGKEIFKQLKKGEKLDTTIAEMEEKCVCSDCILKEAKQKAG